MNTLPHNIVIRKGPRFNVFDEDIRCGWGRGTVVAVKIGKSADQTKLIGSLASGCNKATLGSSENKVLLSRELFRHGTLLYSAGPRYRFCNSIVG